MGRLEWAALAIAFCLLFVMISAIDELSNFLYYLYRHKKRGETADYLGLKRYPLMLRNLRTNLSMPGVPLNAEDLPCILRFNQLHLAHKYRVTGFLGVAFLFLAFLGKISTPPEEDVSAISAFLFGYILLISLLMILLSSHALKRIDRLTAGGPIYKTQYGTVVGKAVKIARYNHATPKYLYLADVRLEDGSLLRGLHIYDKNYFEQAKPNDKCVIYAKNFWRAYVIPISRT